MLQELFFPPEEFACLVLNLTIPLKLYVADAIEAIEVLKNYLGKNKKGMSYIYNIFFICCCCLLFFTVSYKYNTYITYTTNTNNNNFKINNSNNNDSNNVNIIMIYFFV